MKPFDLQAALRGEKFARKSDMREPDEWHYFKTPNMLYGIACVFDNSIFTYTSEGHNNRTQESSYDLVMLPKTKKVWIGISKHQSSNGHRSATDAYPTKEEAMADLTYDRWNFIEVEIETE